MSKKTLIIIGSIIIIALLVLWGYLLFFNNNNTENVNDVTSLPQAELGGFTTSGEGENVIENYIEEAKEKLTHITTKKIAGFSEIIAPFSEAMPTIYYVEQGTGHIFSYTPDNKEEKRVSGTTLSGIDRAVVSPKGDYIAFSKKSNTKNRPFVLGEIKADESRVDTFNFSKEVDDFEFDVAGDNLFYSTRGDFGLEGFSYNLSTNVHKKLFSLPFFEATIIWGKAVNDPIYAYPKPSYLLEGALYEIKNNNIVRLSVSGNGFTGLANNKVIAYSVYNPQERKQNNFLLNRSDNSKKGTDILFLPEKCLIAKSSYTMFCAVNESVSKNTTLPDSWYRGEVSFNDSIWQINEDNINVVVSIKDLSGQEIDISRLNLGFSEKALYFTNKKDNSLWMYEI